MFDAMPSAQQRSCRPADRMAGIGQRQASARPNSLRTGKRTGNFERFDDLERKTL
jgi:hypothetical protein